MSIPMPLSDTSIRIYLAVGKELIEITGCLSGCLYLMALVRKLVKMFLGLTIACARCHDHKFDPILTADYYALASIFASTRQLAKLEGTVSELYFAPLVAKPEADAWPAASAWPRR